MPSYQLAISNIAWQKDDDETVYAAMQQAGFTGLELAPTRIFSEAPYENLTSALLFGGYLKNRWGFSVPSLQSIWYGQKGNIFDPADTEHLLDYTAQAGLSVNLDLSIVLAQGEHLQSFIDDMQYVSHVHISEPGLVPIERRPEHKELALLLGAVGYRGFVSVEMAHTDVDTIRRTMDYIAEVFA